MADSIRQKIVDAVVTRFKTILVAGGYETNLGQKVFVWRDTREDADPFGDTELPALNIRDTKCETQYSAIATQRHQHRLTVEVELWTITATVHTQVRKLIADIHKAIGVDRRWEVAGMKLADNTEPFQDEMGTEHKGKLKGGALFKFIVVYSTRAWDPYTQ